jgi:hypothetical protein
MQTRPAHFAGTVVTPIKNAPVLQRAVNEHSPLIQKHNLQVDWAVVPQPPFTAWGDDAVVVVRTQCGSPPATEAPATQTQPGFIGGVQQRLARLLRQPNSSVQAEKALLQLDVALHVALSNAGSRIFSSPKTDLYHPEADEPEYRANFSSDSPLTAQDKPHPSA